MIFAFWCRYCHASVISFAMRHFGTAISFRWLPMLFRYFRYFDVDDYWCFHPYRPIRFDISLCLQPLFAFRFIVLFLLLYYITHSAWDMSPDGFLLILFLICFIYFGLYCLIKLSGRQGLSYSYFTEFPAAISRFQYCLYKYRQNARIHLLSLPQYPPPQIASSGYRLFTRVISILTLSLSRFRFDRFNRFSIAISSISRWWIFLLFFGYFQHYFHLCSIRDIHNSFISQFIILLMAGRYLRYFLRLPQYIQTVFILLKR